jgi:hypothetical protein
MTNSLVEPNLNVSHQDRLYITAKLVQDQLKVPIKFMNVSNEDQVVLKAPLRNGVNQSIAVLNLNTREALELEKLIVESQDTFATISD